VCWLRWCGLSLGAAIHHTPGLRPTQPQQEDGHPDNSCFLTRVIAVATHISSCRIVYLVTWYCFRRDNRFQHYLEHGATGCTRVCACQMYTYNIDNIQICINMSSLKMFTIIFCCYLGLEMRYGSMYVMGIFHISLFHWLCYLIYNTRQTHN